ncbi:MAG: 30S ribosome-binding factor RbfA [Proteobacteria bacterium]|nr:30S ribosome-binding factor RbfA [Pseudomonadota bacterium]MBU1711213.1 30S ribosome-binding factor RbfA [Pseudomonadota bacterium]
MSRRSKAGPLPGVLAKPKRRPARVADSIRNEVALLVLQKIKDPRIKNITITKVKVTDDLRNAIIFFSCTEDLMDSAEKGLLSSKGFIRSHLAKELGMRCVPELSFERDLTLFYQENVERLLKDV